MEHGYNLKNPAVKRIMQEAKEMNIEDNSEYEAHPLEDNIFEWHFTMRGPEGTEFEEGCYHGRIILPAEYPLKPPEIMFLTPNGRFELNTKVCLSITNHHPEYWQPAWGIRTVILAIRGFFPTGAEGAIGALDYTKEERCALAKRSRLWACPICKVSNHDFVGERKDTTVPNDQATESRPSSILANGKPKDNDIDDRVVSQPTSNQDQCSTVTETHTPIQIPSHPVTHPPQTIPRPPSPPLWLDGIIGALIAAMAVLLIRRYLL